MAAKHRYSGRSRELASVLGNKAQSNLDRTERANALGLAVDEVFELGLVLAQMGITQEEAVRVFRLGKIAEVKGLDERKLIRLNIKE